MVMRNAGISLSEAYISYPEVTLHEVPEYAP